MEQKITNNHLSFMQAYNGIPLSILTVMLLTVTLSTLSSIAAICTIVSAITTIVLNLKKFFQKDKN